MSLSPAAIRTISLAFEAFIFGIYFCNFWDNVSLFLSERWTNRHVYICTSLVFFALGLTHFIVVFYQSIAELAMYFPYTRIDQLRNGLYATATLLGNGFLVYRVFVIWNKRYRPIFLPFVLSLVSFALGLWLTVLRYRETVTTALFMTIFRLFCILTLALNLTSSSMIIYRIWDIQCESSRTSLYLDNEKHFIRRIITIGIESGALYSLLLVSLVITSFESLRATIIIRNCTVSLLGIVVSAIITRVGQGISHGDRISTIPAEFRRGSSRRTNGPRKSMDMVIERVRPIDDAYEHIQLGRPYLDDSHGHKIDLTN